MPEETRNYAVGYGKPPAHTRFVKGRSGNPSGRPRGNSLTALFRAALDKTVTVEIDGRRRRLSKGEAILTRLVDGAVEAEPRSTRLFVQLASKLEGAGGLPDEEEEDDGEDPREYLIRELTRIRERKLYEQAQALERLAEEEAAARARRAAVAEALNAAPKDAA